MAQRVRYITFLKDVALLSITCFGGPQAHISHFQNLLVKRRNYLSDEDLLELNALCQVLPGPTSTQTLTAVGYKLRGPNLAYLTLLIWMLPSVIVMTTAAILLNNIESNLSFTRFIMPMAVGFVAHAAYSISLKTVNTQLGIIVMISSAVISYFIQTPFIFPILLLLAGVVTSFNYKAHPKQEKQKISVPWANFLLWGSVLIFVALLGWVTKSIPVVTIPVRLFENFYRNGSLVFGGGQVLTPMLYTEFVQYAPNKLVMMQYGMHYLSTQEFLSGYALAQSVPGPVFSFSSYIGALSMRGFGVSGEIVGAVMSAAGIFLPGTFLIFFMIRVWEGLKKYRPIRASLEGIHAANAGLVAAAAVVLFQPLDNTIMNFAFTIGTFCLVAFTKLPSWAIIGFGLFLGFFLK